ncbi:hypothetical protein SBA5_240038 [Candidatus Sulfotelmatomonas gaucii]|uniref:Uncharacterized protein n=1 Tax=Candidatus Sulfuritelmatomonas gaucii TaxID=2043161 RepID=A0A2N9L915_9BACT|nr:hypothetical protein SBA5_240038 [Candidatus Sulfotelmatomonas gaucii]
MNEKAGNRSPLLALCQFGFRNYPQACAGGDARTTAGQETGATCSLVPSVPYSTRYPKSFPGKLFYDVYLPEFH